MYEIATKEKLVGVYPICLSHEDLGHFEEAHRRNIQAKFYNEKFPLVYESDNIWDSLYEEHGATMKHKCGKEIVTLPLFYFFYFFLFLAFLFFFLPFFFFFFSLAFPFFGLSFFLFGDNALIMMIITLLFTYNSILRTRYDSI